MTAELAEFVVSLCRGIAAEPGPHLVERLRQRAFPIYIACRDRGRLLHEQWVQASDQVRAIVVGIQRSKEVLRPQDWNRFDTVELCFPHRFYTADMASEADRRRVFGNAHRGIRGIRLARKDDPQSVRLISPTSMVATNRDVAKLLAAFCEMHRLSQQDVQGGAVELQTFEADQFLIPLRADSALGETRNVAENLSSTGPSSFAGAAQKLAPAVPLIRGSRYVPIESIDREYVGRLERLLGDYLVGSVQPNGRMRYLYYPSRGAEEKNRNNQVRQWMATLALCRLARFRSDPTLFDLVNRNLQYNLEHFYSIEDERGIIDDGGKVKLGAVALAALSLIEHRDRHQYQDQETKLLATVDSLWQADGRFRTFLRPVERSDMQNFYPGEALLTWSFLFVEGSNAELWRRFEQSFRFYREWHRANRNPAFIPWHTQAYFNAHQCLRSAVDEADGDSRKRSIDDKPVTPSLADELAEFIFEMNDWLLPVQQWDSAPHADCRGRFYDPHRPFGPPHASSTGVYLEGLIDAFRLARELGDNNRATSYRLAILRGLRSVAQLTFKDEWDMYYIARRGLVRGGVRTAEYDNSVRVDNVQHNLMAIMKILTTFQAEDFCQPV